MKTTIFYHADLDGRTAFYLLKQFYPNANGVECDYPFSKEEELTKFSPGDTVIVVDYHFPKKNMEELKYAIGSDGLIWIDHHLSAIRELEGGHYAGLRKEGVCGAELVWEYCMGTEIPFFLKVVGDFDLFRTHGTPKFEEETFPVFCGLEYLGEKFLEEIIHILYKSHTEEEYEDTSLWETYENKFWNMFHHIENIGKILTEQKKKEAFQFCKDHAFTRIIFGKKALCLNAKNGGMMAQLSRFYDPKEWDFILSFYYGGKNWNYGFYTNGKIHPEMDCSKIARDLGGGGHPCAAGCSLPYLLKEIGA